MDILKAQWQIRRMGWFETNNLLPVRTEGFGIKATCTVFVCVYIDDCIVRKTETEQTVCVCLCG